MWIKATRSGVTEKVSPEPSQAWEGDLGEKARSKLREGGFGQLPRVNLSEAMEGPGLWHHTQGVQHGPALVGNGCPTLHEEQRGDQTKKLLLGYSSSWTWWKLAVPLHRAWAWQGDSYSLGGGWAPSWKLLPDPGARLPCGVSPPRAQREARSLQSPPGPTPGQDTQPLSCSLSAQCPARRPESRGCSCRPGGPARPWRAPLSYSSPRLGCSHQTPHRTGPPGR